MGTEAEATQRAPLPPGRTASRHPEASFEQHPRVRPDHPQCHFSPSAPPPLPSVASSLALTSLPTLRTLVLEPHHRPRRQSTRRSPAQNAILKGHTSQPSHQHVEPHPTCNENAPAARVPNRECTCCAFAIADGPATGPTSSHARRATRMRLPRVPNRECTCRASAIADGPATSPTSSHA